MPDRNTNGKTFKKADVHQIGSLTWFINKKLYTDIKKKKKKKKWYPFYVDTTFHSFLKSRLSNNIIAQ